MLDEELLDDVGYGIYVRCQDMLEVAEAGRGYGSRIVGACNSRNLTYKP